MSPISAIKRSSSLFKQTWGNQVAANFGFGIFQIIALLISLGIGWFFGLINGTFGIAIGLLCATASISIICGGASPGIEPIAANSFTQKTLSGSFNVKNPHLKSLLAEKGQDNDEVWSSITINKGSVQHLDFLDLRTTTMLSGRRALDCHHPSCSALR